MTIAAHITSLRKRIPQEVQIIAVSKTKPIEALLEAYQAGQRAFGENKVQEMLQKQPLMPPDTAWHLIGHLQTNKVKYIVPFVSLIHSVDSFKLLAEINKEAMRIDRKVECLLQLHIASEESKFGLSFDEAHQLLRSDQFRHFTHVKVKGLMGMATFTDDIQQVRREFLQLKDYFDEIKNTYFADDVKFDTLSMGMSGDFEIAIACGSTMVRIGSLIFGERNYNH
ncbi:MAG: YggS family pyridoxal phosphate-dependent enzyme [Bacteroidales bacterium]|nr:YggS family pyridoxal phosphate-dependent enzyme [Bacteroidales bacterium]